MLSDNIRNYRKKINLSQDELAEKVGVSRQSVSFWETGQTQPTIDNIVALSKIFNISSDELLGNSDIVSTESEKASQDKPPKKNGKAWLIIVICLAVSVLIGAAIFFLYSKGILFKKPDSDNIENTSAVESQISNISSVPVKKPTGNTGNTGNTYTTSKSPTKASTPENTVVSSEPPATEPVTSVVANVQIDLFKLCKDYAISKGELNGDYCMYQQPSSKYGGYDNEYFSITYWGDSDMVEFCLHCPLSDTQSHNFYLRMRGGYNGKYEYVSSKYYRDSGESIREASGYIDPAVFSDNYPISCDDYYGSTDKQNDFMEETRVGMCDLIHCLKQFTKVENMGLNFSNFEFVNF